MTSSEKRRQSVGLPRRSRRRNSSSGFGGVLAALPPATPRLVRNFSLAKSFSDAGGESTPSPRCRSGSRSSKPVKTPPPSSVIVSSRLAHASSFSPDDDKENSPMTDSDDVSSLSSYHSSKKKPERSKRASLSPLRTGSPIVRLSSSLEDNEQSEEDEEELLHPMPLFQDDPSCSYRADDEELSEKETESEDEFSFSEDDDSSIDEPMVPRENQEESDDDFDPEEESESDDELEVKDGYVVNSNSRCMTPNGKTSELEDESHEVAVESDDTETEDENIDDIKANSDTFISLEKDAKSDKPSDAESVPSHDKEENESLVEAFHDLDLGSSQNGQKTDFNEDPVKQDEKDIIGVVEAMEDRNLAPSQLDMDNTGDAVASHSLINMTRNCSEPERVVTKNGNARRIRQRSPKGRSLSKREGSVPRGKWIVGSKLGSGSQGSVRMGMNKKTGTLMAVKTVQMERAVMRDIRREIELLRSLDHVNIVRYLGAEMNATQLHIFQEWVPGGSITLLLNKFGPFSMQVTRSYLGQALSGLVYLHDNDILHRDIKGGNILVNDAGVVKLADFGSSKRLAHKKVEEMETQTMRGTPFFMAPEVFEEVYDAKADVWSIGCVAYQMTTGMPPWKSLGFTNPMSLFKHIKSTQGPPELMVAKGEENPSGISLGDTTGDVRLLVDSLLVKCFFRDPSMRPSAKELMTNAAFFTDIPTSEEETNSDGGMFSPGGESFSSALQKMGRSPVPMNQKPPRTPCLLSPPLLPSKFRHSGVDTRISPPCTQHDSNDWPSWAKRQWCENQSDSNCSLAFSTDSNTSKNPFGRRNSSSLSTLDGVDFVS